MGFPHDTPGRASQSKYWTLFGLYMIAVPALLIVGVIPLGIYWRVIMMRRCRDIGWPAFLPWLIFGGQFAAGFGLQIGAVSGTAPGWSMVALPLVLGLVDFVFSIVIGCENASAIRTRLR